MKQKINKVLKVVYWGVALFLAFIVKEEGFWIWIERVWATRSQDITAVLSLIPLLLLVIFLPYRPRPDYEGDE